MSDALLPRGARYREVLAGLFVAVIIGVLVTQPSGLRIAIAVVLAVPGCVIARRRPLAALNGLVLWLFAIGLVRRLISGISPKSAMGDPLLLIGFAAWIVLASLAVKRGALSQRSRLTDAALALGGLLAASAANPIQGGLSVGLSGALLVVVPMSAFLIGRTIVDDLAFSRLLGLVAALGVVAALYGHAQTFVGFPAWDATWIANEGYTALNVGTVFRPFASFSAASEYLSFLGIAIVAWVVHSSAQTGWASRIGALVVIGSALWYGSGRGILVLTVLAVTLMLAARAGYSLGRAVLLGGIVLAALPSFIGGLSPAQFSDGAGSLVQHQVEGLTDPFGENSTLPGHIALVRRGIESAISNPLGVGVGSITISADKFGGIRGGPEADPGRAPFAAGVPGLLAYLAVVAIGVSRAYRLAASRKDPVSLAVLGILMVTFLQWLNSGQYAVVFLPWLALGWVDSKGTPHTETRLADPQTVRAMTNSVKLDPI